MNLQERKMKVIERIALTNDEAIISKMEAALKIKTKPIFKTKRNNQKDEEALWKNFSSENFIKGYGEDEPEYTDADIKEPNPEYKAWKEK